MAENSIERHTTKTHLDMVDPLVYHELLNSVAGEIPIDNISSPEVQSVIDDMFDIANGKGHDEKRYSSSCRACCSTGRDK